MWLGGKNTSNKTHIGNIKIGPTNISCPEHSKVGKRFFGSYLIEGFVGINFLFKLEWVFTTSVFLRCCKSTIQLIFFLIAMSVHMTGNLLCGHCNGPFQLSKCAGACGQGDAADKLWCHRRQLLQGELPSPLRQVPVLPFKLHCVQ